MQKVILLDKLNKLGDLGQLVKVKKGYARNFLLPQGLAVLANDANLAKFEENRAVLEAKPVPKSEELIFSHRQRT